MYFTSQTFGLESISVAEAAVRRETELDTWTAFARAARLLVAQLDRDLQRESGLSITAYELLSLLARAPGQALRMSELADATHSSPSRITHAIDQLAARDWVIRKDCAEDRRGCSASLTPAGESMLERATAKHDASVRAHLLDHLSPAQLDELCAISRSVLEHLCRVRPR
jgi:DNA-binding MarR family transcriptional regulator